jgi:hypothetical protein
MSKLVKFNFKYPLTLIQEVKGIVAIAWANPREIVIENPYTAFAGSFGTIASLWFAAYNPSGVGVIFIISLIMFLVGIAIEANKYKIYTEDALPIPVVINITPSRVNSVDALNSLFNVNLIQAKPEYRNYRKNIEKYLGITEADLVHEYKKDIFDLDYLKTFLITTQYHLEQRVKPKTPQNSIFYLVYIGPISVAFLVGSMFGREGMLLFQRSQDHNSYQCVMEVKDRKLKEDTPEFEKFNITYQKGESRQTKVTIAIDAAAHKIKLNDPNITNYGDIIHLQNKTGNSISFEEDWTQYCREIFKVLNEAQQEYEEIKLVYSMPVNLGVAVGMTTQHFWPILLTNYDEKTGRYKDLIKMNEITYRH